MYLYKEEEKGEQKEDECASISHLSPIMSCHTMYVCVQEGDQDKAAVYRAMLIQAIHQCAVKFPDVADSVVHVLMDFLSGDGAIDVIIFVR